ncbi:MAG: T9SS type A sorting domain-containing protein, partial [Treponemataceae bacterium]|nr:T9SS type A sorting domain-containing protein [Treponemataceae bacterium]
SGSIIIYTGTTATAQDYVTGADTIKVDKSSGTFTFGSGLSVAAGKSVTLANGAVSVSGDVSISVNGSLAVGASVPVTVTGNWTNNGTFNAGNNSTVTFAPSAADKTATITGDNTWQNLTCTTAGATLKFGAGTTQTVNGVFTVTGTTGSDITLDSTSTSPWVLKMSSVDAAHLQLSYVTVSHSTASPAIMSVIDVSGTTVSEGSSGTTTGWFYVVIPGTTFGVSYAFAVYGEKDLYVAFDAQIDPATLSAVPAALDLSSNAIRTGSSATMVQNTVSGTVVLLTLTDTVTVSHIQNGVLTATAGNGAVLSKDGSKHLDPTVSAYLTPLVVNLVSPLLATEDTDAGPHTIRLFDGSGTAANALSAGSDAVLQTKTAENVKYQLLITQNSGWQSQSGCENLASWLAIESQSLPAANTITATSTSGSNTVFDIPATLGLNKDKPVHFFFGLTDASGAPLKNGSDTQLMAICAPDGNPWQKMTLWSYSLSDVITQEGGVTIRNNVINSLTGEETVIQVELSSRGPLNVQILTLDGNVVKTLQKGTLAAGTYYFRWNGTNRNGAAVARGMYFVRISGKDIDQTRKVMVIRE